LGFLRFFLAITVVIGHSGPIFGMKFLNGYAAVEIFFIISGFYMALILETKYVGKGSYGLFISNRFLRLYPMYWVVLLTTLIISLIFGIGSGNWLNLTPYLKWHDVMTVPAMLVQFVANVFLLGQDIVMFMGMSPETGQLFFTKNFWNTNPQFWTFLFLPQAWSLALEMSFYLIAPFIIRAKTTTIVSIVLLSLILRAVIYFYLGWTNDPWINRFFPTELALFLLGMSSYRVYVKCVNGNSVLDNYGVLVMPIFFLILLFYPFFPGQLIRAWLFYGFTALCLPFLFHQTRKSKMDNRIGELSYPLYVVHILLIAVMGQFLSKEVYSVWGGVIAVMVSVVASLILIKYVANPIEGIREARKAKLQPINS